MANENEQAEKDIKEDKVPGGQIANCGIRPAASTVSCGTMRSKKGLKMCEKCFCKGRA